MSNLYAMNTAARLWKTRDKLPSAAWQKAICEAAGILQAGSSVVVRGGEYEEFLQKAAGRHGEFWHSRTGTET